MKTPREALARVDLPREEWDFRAQPDPKKKTKKGDWTADAPLGSFNFLPEDDVWFCWNYEFSRHTSEREFISKWRQGAEKPDDFDSLLAHYWLADPFGKEGSVVAEYFYKTWPEWPEKPFLSVSLAERQRRYNKCWGHEPKRKLRLVRLKDIYRFVVALKAGEDVKLPLPGREHWGAELGDDLWTVPKRTSRKQLPPIEIAAFEIDFELPDKVLANRFRRWLALRRKEKEYKAPDERRTRTLRSELMALGALHLLDSGWSASKAQEFTAKVSGSALYEDETDWSHARKTAQSAIYRAS